MGGFQKFRRNTSLSILFDEAVNLTREDREVREVARKNCIPLDVAEKVRDEFRKLDCVDADSSTECVGVLLCYDEFSQLLRSLASSSFSADKNELMETRLRYLWKEIDTVGRGQVEFEQFLVWFHKVFQGEVGLQTSQHSHLPATLSERFYASLGTKRLRDFAKRAKDDDSP